MTVRTPLVERCVGAFILRDQNVLLGLRGHQKSFPNSWDMFGGHIENDESETQALIRELGEELGICPLEFRKIQHVTITSKHNELNLAIYVVMDWSGGDPIMLGNEHTQIKWFPLTDAIDLKNLAAPEIMSILRTLV